MSEERGTFHEAQTRWLIGKLVSRGNEVISEKQKSFTAPSTYTPANIELRPYEGNRDLSTFWKLIESYKAE